MSASPDARPRVDIADDSFIAAPQELVAKSLADLTFWQTCWPSVSLARYHDRGIEGTRWYVTGALTGTAEVWLEPFQPDGTLVHIYLRTEIAGRARHPDRVRERYVVSLKKALWSLKDDLEVF